MNLNIVTINSEANPNYKDELAKNEYTVHFYDEATLDFEQAKDQEIFILYYRNAEDINRSYELLMKIKRTIARPVYIMTEGLSPVERLIYLKLGVVGFLSTDFTPEELYLFFENRQEYLQKYQDKKKGNKVTPNSELQLDGEYRLAIRRNKEVQLTVQEFSFLKLLYNNCERAVPYKQIYERLWFDNEFEKSGKQKIANVALRVRLKLNSIHKEHEYVKSVRSLGYRFNN